MKGYKKKLESLLAEKNNYQSIINKINADIEELRKEVELPALRKQYVGRYFKCKNSYSSSDESWFLYTYVLDVSDYPQLKVIQFEKDCYGKVSIEVSCETFSDLLGKRISEREFKKAVDNIVKKSIHVLI